MKLTLDQEKMLDRAFELQGRITIKEAGSEEILRSLQKLGLLDDKDDGRIRYRDHSRLFFCTLSAYDQFVVKAYERQGEK